MHPRSYLSTGELAKLSNVTKHTILAAIENGRLKATRTPGGHNRIHVEDARRFLRQHNIPITRLAGIVPAVLVVDDDTDLLQLMRKALADENVIVELASCGYDAGILAARLKPQVIVLDVLLPDIDGRTICRQIKSNAVTKDAQALAITALRGEKEMHSIYNAGFDDYLAKPFSLQELKRKVLWLLRRWGKPERLRAGSEANEQAAEASGGQSEAHGGLQATAGR